MAPRFQNPQFHTHNSFGVLHLHFLMKVRQFLFVLVLMMTVTACYHEIDMDRYRGDGGQDLIVLNSLCNPDSVVQVSATRTFFFSDVHPAPVYITDLQMKVSIDGEDFEPMVYDAQRNLYQSSIKPKEGVEICIIAHHSTLMAQVEACDVMPHRVNIEHITSLRQGPLHVYSEQDYIFTYRITFTDTPDQTNYYFLQYDTPDEHSPYRMGERDFTYEYVFQQLAREISDGISEWTPYSYTGLPFSDKGIEGQKHTLIVREILQNPNGFDHWTEMPRLFRLYSISKNYYEYIVSVLRNSTSENGLQGGLIDLGLSEPGKVFTNIIGGTGILGSYVLDEKVVDVFQLPEN